MERRVNGNGIPKTIYTHPGLKSLPLRLPAITIIFSDHLSASLWSSFLCMLDCRMHQGRSTEKVLVYLYSSVVHVKLFPVEEQLQAAGDSRA